MASWGGGRPGCGPSPWKPQFSSPAWKKQSPPLDTPILPPIEKAHASKWKATWGVCPDPIVPDEDTVWHPRQGDHVSKKKYLPLCNTRLDDQHTGKSMSQQFATKLAGVRNVDPVDHVPEGRHPSPGQAGAHCGYFRLGEINVEP